MLMKFQKRKMSKNLKKKMAKRIRKRKMSLKWEKCQIQMMKKPPLRGTKILSDIYQICNFVGVEPENYK